MNYLIYILFRILVFKFSLLPFSLMYVFSDFLAFILGRVVKYRRKVVFENLRKCFPDFSEHELKKTAHAFYGHLSDIILESIKGFSMNEKTLRARYKFRDEGLIEKCYEEGRDIICAAAHVGNWEWPVRMVQNFFRHDFYGVYKPIQNKYIDAYIKKCRGSNGITLLTMNETLNHMRGSFDTPRAYVLISDQSPSSAKNVIWTDFFNHKTACIPGMEFAARNFKMTVILMTSVRIKRGHYHVLCDLLTDTPEAMSKGQISQLYMSGLEARIKNNPHLWLWSHRRFKHTYVEKQ